MPSDEDRPETEPKSKFVKAKPYVIAILVVALVALIALALFWYYQTIVAHVSLQGFWHISGDFFLLIDESLIRFIKIVQGGTYDLVFEEMNVEFVDSLVPSLYGHSYTLKRSTDTTFAIGDLKEHAFNKKSITLDIIPTTGTIQVKEGSKEVMRLIKDNAMSSEYLSTRQNE